MATGHGSTPAAWTGVGVALFGCLVASVGCVWSDQFWLFWVGLAIVAIGAILGGVLGAMGFGAARDTRQRHPGAQPKANAPSRPIDDQTA
ncbi:MAG: HGxxPAAW family protein [Actinomycetales bacterium]